MDKLGRRFPVAKIERLAYKLPTQRPFNRDRALALTVLSPRELACKALNLRPVVNAKYRNVTDEITGTFGGHPAPLHHDR